MSEIPYGDVVVDDKVTGEKIINPEYYNDYPNLRHVKPVNITEHFAKTKKDNNDEMNLLIRYAILFGVFFSWTAFTACENSLFVCICIAFFWAFIGSIVGVIVFSIFMKRTFYVIIASVIMNILGMSMFSFIFCASIILNLVLLFDGASAPTATRSWLRHDAQRS